MGNNLSTSDNGEDKHKNQHDYKKRLNSIFFSSSSSLPPALNNIQQQKQTQEDYLYNLFKNYNYNQLQNLYLEYEYLELLKENFFLNFKLPRVPLAPNHTNINILNIQIVKFSFTQSSNIHQIIKIDALTLTNSSTYFKRLISTKTTTEQEIKLNIDKTVLTYNEMYFIKKFLNTNKINFELFFNSIPLAVDIQLKTQTSQLQCVLGAENINEENILKLLEFYYKSTFLEIDSLNIYIENYILSLIDDQMNTELFIFLLNSTSLTKHTEYIYEMALNKFLLKFNKLFFNDSKTTRLSLKKCKLSVGGNNTIHVCDLLNSLNRNVLIDILKSNYLNINELNLFKLCLKWSKNKIEEDKRIERLKQRNGDDDDEIHYLSSSGGSRRRRGESPSKKFKNLFRLSTSSSFKLVKLKRNFSKILNKQKSSDDFVTFNNTNESKEEDFDSKKFMCLLNELVKHLNLNLLINELNYLIDKESIEPEGQYYSQEYNYLMNIINNLNIFNKNELILVTDSNQPDFIVNNKKLKHSSCRLNKPTRLNGYLMEKLSKYLSHSFEPMINLPDMVNSTLSSRNEDNGNNEEDIFTGGNNFIFSKNDVEIYGKLKTRFYELKNFYEFLYKHKKCDRLSLDKILKLKVFQEP